MRDQWKTRTGFLFATIGAAVGLGNLWRFPFQAYKNGGGAFLLPYVVAILTCAIPMMILEHAYGRKIRGGSVKAFSALKKRLEVVGWIQVMVPVVVMMFYSTIISVAGMFMIYSLGHAFGIVNWMGSPGDLMGQIVGEAENAFDFARGISPYMLIGVVFVWLLNYGIVRAGISGGIEKMTKIFTPMLMILMAIFMVQSLRLTGAASGLEALFTPDFSKLSDPNIWVSAYAQVFFSTTLAVGVMIAYGSYLSKEADIVGNSILTVLGNTSFDLIAGITVFATLGYLVQTQGAAFDSFGSGAGVAFIAFPIAISTMSSSVLVQGLFGFLFFFCLFIAGISSSISMLEAFNTAAMDKFKISRQKMTGILALIGFAGSALFATYSGFNYILDLVDEYVANYVIATLGLVEVIAICYLFGIHRLQQEANESSSLQVGTLWRIILKYFTPVLLGINIVMNFVTGTQKLLDLEPLDLRANLVFGWGTVALMIGASIWFYLKTWTANAQEQATPLTEG